MGRVQIFFDPFFSSTGMETSHLGVALELYVCGSKQEVDHEEAVDLFIHSFIHLIHSFHSFIHFIHSCIVGQWRRNNSNRTYARLRRRWRTSWATESPTRQARPITKVFRSKTHSFISSLSLIGHGGSREPEIDQLGHPRQRLGAYKTRGHDWRLGRQV